MPIIVCGINHRTASLALREQIYFAQDRLPLYLQDLLGSGLAKEAVLLSTCNRSELYCDSSEVAGVQEWFCQQSAVWKNANEALGAELRAGLYLYQDEKAVEHLMRVAAGLDSMVLGEPEILGQVKMAFSESCSAGAVATVFHRLFQQVFAVAKEIRSSTQIGACPMSIASTTMLLAKQELLSKLNKKMAESKLLLLGAGDTIQLILRYLQTNAAQKMWIVNRDAEKAALLAETYGGEARPLTELQDILPQADLMITATGSLEPLLTVPMLEVVLSKREQPLLIFDIAVPRDVAPEAASLKSLQLYCIDDLKVIIQESHSNRQHAAEKAQEVIKKHSDDFMQQQRSKEQVSETIRAYRERIESICSVELNKALRHLAEKQEAEVVLRQFAYAVTNKLLHTPSVQLRQAGSEGRFDLLRLAKQLLALPELDTNVL